jgi:hypothetical protein
VGRFKPLLRYARSSEATDVRIDTSVKGGSMRVGMVGNGTDKFTEFGEKQARELIGDILFYDGIEAMVSGHSPVGGIDIWAEEAAISLGIELDLKIPEINQWNPDGYGYKARNLDIAADSDVLHVILADKYPTDYEGMRFDLCYHCRSNDHVKSGGCWTGKQAQKMGKEVHWHIIENFQKGE